KRVVEKRSFFVRFERLRWIISGMSAETAPIRNKGLRNIGKLNMVVVSQAQHLPSSEVGAQEGVEAFVSLGQGVVDLGGGAAGPNQLHEPAQLLQVGFAES